MAVILIAKLLLAHLAGDFILQPASWVADKERRTYKSRWLYVHVLLHFTLAAALVWSRDFIVYAAIIAVLHGFTDLLKLIFQRPQTQRRWFIADQIAHIAIFIAAAVIYAGDCPICPDESLWIYATGALLLTTPASIVIRNVISGWAPNGTDLKQDLQNAGKSIGILERLFVFAFILSGHFEAIGFLLAAKSVFRFGDLSQAKDRRLTEYVLIGTLLSFGIATAAGLLAQQALELVQNPFVYPAY
jgi:hypothetical protein